MQLDKTRIAVRERDIFDILDLALHVFRQNFVPLCIAMLIGVIPWFVVNYWLVSWMLPSDFDAPGTPEYNGYLVRYFWNMMVLIVLEMPFAGAIATVYLGEVLFVDQPSLRTSARHVIKAIPASAGTCWCCEAYSHLSCSWPSLIEMRRSLEWSCGWHFFSPSCCNDVWWHPF